VYHIIIIVFIIFQFIEAKENPYKTFQMYMNTPQGRVMNINFTHEQDNQQLKSNGIFYYFKENNYIYDDKFQRIRYLQEYIQTINKKEKQIIYDANISKDFNVLNLLTGSSNEIRIGETLIEKDGMRIPFSFKDLNISGIIWTVPSTGAPKKIIINLSMESKILIKIYPLKSDNRKTLKILDTKDYEIIDLRE
tara:strand:- start:222 stop:800 length:579 start_codon:yes stop_codon:yes gene_type:complete